MATWRRRGARDAILKQEPNIHKTNSVFTRMTPLHEAARAGDGEIVKMLIEAGADIKATDLHDDLPIHWAVRNSHRAAAMELLAADKDMETLEFPNMRGKIPRGRQPYIYIYTINHINIY